MRTSEYLNRRSEPTNTRRDCSVSFCLGPGLCPEFGAKETGPRLFAFTASALHKMDKGGAPPRGQGPRPVRLLLAPASTRGTQATPPRRGDGSAPDTFTPGHPGNPVHRSPSPPVLLLQPPVLRFPDTRRGDETQAPARPASTPASSPRYPPLPGFDAKRRPCIQSISPPATSSPGSSSSPAVSPADVDESFSVAHVSRDSTQVNNSFGR